MRNTVEKDVEGKAIAFAKGRGILCLKLNLLGNTGYPDRAFFHLGSVVLIEFKRPGDDLERNQPERIEELVRRRFTVGVFDDVTTSCDFLEATLLSEKWRQDMRKSGVCWIALQTRSWENVRGLYGIPYFAGEGVRR